MKKEQLAVQLFTLRDYIKTPADIAKSMKRVKQIGYDAVQVSGMGPIAEEELVKILDGEGLVCCATHENGKMIVDETEKVIERLNKLNCKYTAYPHPHMPTAELNSTEIIIELAKKMNTAAEKMATAGQILTYHNHACEFAKFDGKTMLDIFYDEAPALQSELDTFWIQHGGGCPTAWIKKMAGRLPLLHLKEFGISQGNDIAMYHIGGGNLMWDSILAEAEKGETEWFIIEQDRDWIDNDPFKALQLSFEYLTENFVK